MSELAEELLGLLDGDFVELDLPSETVRAEVVDRKRGPRAKSTETRARTITFMPIEEPGPDDPDRYRVTIVEDEAGAWRVDEVVEEVFSEDTLEYEATPCGDLVGVTTLELRE